MKKNIAVVGCGYWGKNLVRNFSELGALGSICDPDRELAKLYGTEYGVDELSFEAILNSKSVEGVALAVPASLHAAMAMEAMESGKHVYVEKPLALNSSDAEEMIKASKRNNVQLMVGHLLQYHPAFAALRELVGAGRLGSLNYAYSNRLSFGRVRSEEDVLWSFAPHDISMILSLAEQMPENLRVESSKILQENVADVATIHMGFKSGLSSHVSVSWIHPYKEHKLVVIGEDATAVFDDTKVWSEKLALYAHHIRSSEGAPMLAQEKVEYSFLEKSEPLRNECIHFLDVVDGKVLPFTDGAEGLKVLQVLSAAAQSEIKNQTVRL